jgi:hypothetical protein
MGPKMPNFVNSGIVNGNLVLSFDNDCHVEHNRENIPGGSHRKS